MSHGRRLVSGSGWYPPSTKVKPLRSMHRLWQHRGILNRNKSNYFFFCFKLFIFSFRKPLNMRPWVDCYRLGLVRVEELGVPTQHTFSLGGTQAGFGVIGALTEILGSSWGTLCCWGGNCCGKHLFQRF